MPAFPRLLGVAAACLFLTAGARKVTDPITPERVGGATRFLTHVTTDKPIYKIGETVYARGVVLDAKSRVPAPNGQYAQITIKGPKGETITAGQAQVTDGAFGFSWVVPEGQAGGEFTLSAAGAYGHAPGERKFDVRVYRAPRLKNQITFARDGYGQGDTLTATLETTRAEGGVPKGAKITAVARVDGVDAARAPCTIDEKGRCTVSLKLPANIERGEGTLAFTIEDGGVVETATKTIPLLVTSFEVAVYPEGGDLIAGLTNRVYLEARTLSKKPADIAGVIVDSKGKEVSTFRTEHEGRGRFTLDPVRGESYTLKVTEPASVKKTVALPALVNEGATMISGSELTPADQPVKLTVAWTGDRVVKVTLRQRDLELSTVDLDARKQKGTEVSLDAKGAEGVLVATVFAKDGTPLAERLVFRGAKKTLNIELKADRERYVPGAPVALKLKTTIDGKPAAAFVGLTVTDDSIQELIEKREQAPNLPVMVFLEDDVRELADAHVYLDAKNPKSKLAVDLLLGTQGWRRFAMINVADFLNREQDEARRVLAMFDGQSLIEAETVSLVDFAPRGGAMPGRPMNAFAAPMPAAMPQPNKPADPVAVAPPAPQPVQPVVVAKPPAEKREAKLELAKEVMARDVGDRRQRIAAGPMADERMRIPFAFVTIREFAHQVRPNRQPNDRLDFAETLYWAASVKTDANGEATVKFGMSDAVTSFRAAADGFTAGGVLGAAETKLDSVKAFYVEPKLPLEVTEGDVIRLPIAFINGTREPLNGVSMAITSKADLRFTAPQAFALKSDERARKVVEISIGPKTRSTELTLNATAGGYSDVVTRELSIKPKGFPVQQASGGLLLANGKASFKFTLPADTVPGSVSTSIAIYPSPAGNLTSALKSMIKEPSGCFEQTSSTVYPMTMAVQYFNTHTGSDPAVLKDAQDKLERGYKRLVGFECKQKGYEWFGEDPGHEALTAYGILEFTDISKVRSVDATMLSNSKAWLLKQRDGKGGFERKRRALHTWIEDKDTSDAYITWALLESGEKNLSAEVKRVKEAGLASSNSYVIAVAANVAQLSGDAATAGQMLKKLAAKQDEKGFVGGGTQSIVGSTGLSLGIETTAFATLAWLRGATTTWPTWRRRSRAWRKRARTAATGRRRARCSPCARCLNTTACVRRAGSRAR